MDIVDQIHKHIGKLERQLEYSKPQYKLDCNVRYALKHIRTGKLMIMKYNRYSNKNELAPMFSHTQDIYMLRSLKDIRYIRKHGASLLKYYTQDNNLIGHSYQPKHLKIVKVKLNFTEILK